MYFMLIYDEKKNNWISLRQTAEYKKRKKIVKDAWIFVGLFLLILPLAAQLSIALFCTFVSFSFLDEGAYQFSNERSEK